MKDLRKLAKDHAQKTIDPGSYRKSRRKLIQAICSGKVVVKENTYLAPLEKLEDITEKRDTWIANESGYSGAAPTNSEAARQKTIVAASLVTVILCLIVLAIFLLSDTEEESSEISFVDGAVKEASAGQSLIIEFIQQKNWTRENLNSFFASWQQLSVHEHKATHASHEMTRLTNAIYRQLLDERALISLGDIDNAIANQILLVDFAEKLNIEDKRFTVVKPESALEFPLDQALANPGMKN